MGEAAILLYSYTETLSSRQLLARSILAYHYNAIEKLLIKARMVLKNENVLIPLINLNILYSAARGLRWIEQYNPQIKVIANKKYVKHYNDFLSRSILERNIINIQVLNIDYLKLRDRSLGFNLQLMRLSNKPFLRFAGNVAIKLAKYLSKKNRNNCNMFWCNPNQMQLPDFKKMYANRFASESIVDLKQAMISIELIDFDRTENFSYKNQLNLLLEIQKLLLWQLKIIPDDDYNDHDRNYPNESAGKYLAKSAHSIIKLTTNDAVDIWKPIFSLNEYFHNWINVFISSWFYNELNTDHEVAQFASTWHKMLEFVQNAPNWNIENLRYGYRFDELWIELLGMNTHSVFLSNEKLIPVVDQMKPFYLNWAKTRLRGSRAFNSFAYFCSSVVGDAIIRDGTIWIAAAINKNGDRFKDDTAVLLTGLCEKVWAKYNYSLDHDRDLQSAFFVILNFASSMNAPAAKRLYSSIENAHRTIL